MEILENGRHTQEEMPAGLADDALVEAAVVEAHTAGETMAMADAARRLDGMYRGCRQRSKPPWTQSTALRFVANEDARLTGGGGFGRKSQAVTSRPPTAGLR
ncbi:MAG: hypothetical protein R2838_25535 [Caldilineaceae bacterium]